MRPSRYIRHSRNPPVDYLDAINHDISSALSLNLEQVYHNTRRAARSTSGGVYTGIAGITLMVSRLSSRNFALSPAFISLGDQVLASAVKLSVSEGDLKVRSPARASFLETDVGASTLMLLRLIERSSGIHINDSSWQYCIQLLQLAVAQITSRRFDADDGCEVLYGRAGLLYALLLIRGAIRVHADSVETSGALPDKLLESLDRLASDDNICVIVKAIIDFGREGAREYAEDIAGSGSIPPPLMWVWHGKRYLGAAHGVAGILQMLWNCPSHIVVPYLTDMLGTLMWLVGQQDKSGNWPTKALITQGSDTGDNVNELVQWCHGAPGIIILLSTAIRRSLAPQDHLSIGNDLQEKVIESLRRGGRVVYRHGLLRKGVGICHGVAGSVYALLAVSDIVDHHSRNTAKPDQTANKKYLLRAAHLAYMATSHETLTANGEMSTQDHPWSLYEGMAGMCCAWAEVLLRLEGKQSLYKGMPGFDDLHEPLVL